MASTNDPTTPTSPTRNEVVPRTIAFAGDLTREEVERAAAGLLPPATKDGPPAATLPLYLSYFPVVVTVTIQRATAQDEAVLQVGELCQRQLSRLHFNSPFRMMLSMSRVEPTWAAAASSVTPPRSSTST